MNTWNLSIPNGTYSVTICTGDASWPSGKQSVQAEDIPVIEDGVLSGETHWIKDSTVVIVDDGSLTLTFVGSEPNATLCWVQVSSN